MRIVVDVSPLSRAQTGIGTYLVGMLRGLVQAGEGRNELVAFALASPRGTLAIENALEGLPVERRLLAAPPPSQSWRTGWSRLGWPALERLVGRFDVFHFSDWMFPPQRGGLRATTIYDLVPLRFPDWVTPATRRLHLRKYRAATACDPVFAISRFTAKDVTELLRVSPKHIEVAYPGVDGKFRPDGPGREFGAPYVLSVATLEPRKNVASLIKAFERLHTRRPELMLLLAGAEGWGDRPDLVREGVRGLGFVPREELPALYRGASAFVFPSYFEGFGMPVLEAMASGTPAVVSSHPSLDEASGVAAFRTDPESPDAISDAIERALEDDGTAVERGLAHAGRFTWRACGEALLTGYLRGSEKL